MLAVLRDFAPDTVASDDFAAQWFHDVVVPEYEFSDVTKTREGEEWVVRGTVASVGTGRMSVEVRVARAVSPTPTIGGRNHVEIAR